MLMVTEHLRAIGMQGVVDYYNTPLLPNQTVPALNSQDLEQRFAALGQQGRVEAEEDIDAEDDGEAEERAEDNHHVPDPNRFVLQAQPPFHPTDPPLPATKLMADPATLSGRTNNASAYGDHLRDKPLSHVQPPLGIAISLQEIATFLPNWFQIPDVAARAIRNGIGDHDIAKLQLHAINTLTAPEMVRARARLRQQLSQGGKIVGGKPATGRWSSEAYRERVGPQDDLTADAWDLRGHWENSTKVLDFTHIKLVHIYSIVPTNRWPTGMSRLLLTQCLHFASSNPHLDLDTSHFDWIIQTQGLQLNVTPTGADYDTATIAEFHRAVANP